MLSLCARSSPLKPPPPPPKQVTESPFSRINRLAPLSKAGGSTATVGLTHQLFTNVGVSNDIADAFGFTNRVVQAQIAYRNGQHPAIHESDVVKAVNDMARAIGAPQWASTNLTEVRRLRVHMLVIYPRLLADQGPPDSHGHYKLLSDDLSPMEASYIASTMIYQKIFNSRYQFTDAERVANASLTKPELRKKHLAREKAMLDILNGRTQSFSVMDLLNVADQFFNDLGIPPTTYSDASIHLPANDWKGGQ